MPSLEAIKDLLPNVDIENLGWSKQYVRYSDIVHIPCQFPWWRHQMETFSALLAICAENSAVTGEFPAQRPVTRKFDVFFDMRPNKLLSKQSWGWWFETPPHPLWRHLNAFHSLRSEEAYMHRWLVPSLNLMMAYHLFGNKSVVWVDEGLLSIPTFDIRARTALSCVGGRNAGGYGCNSQLLCKTLCIV